MVPYAATHWQNRWLAYELAASVLLFNMKDLVYTKASDMWAFGMVVLVQ